MFCEVLSIFINQPEYLASTVLIAQRVCSNASKRSCSGHSADLDHFKKTNITSGSPIYTLLSGKESP